RLLIPAVAKCHQACVRTQAQMRCAIVAVAAERYRLKFGKWPESIDTLVDEKLLKAVPLDPYEPGKPIKLNLSVDGLVIYSVGLDGVDNNGALNREKPMEPGTDLGLQLWDPAHRRQPPRVPKAKAEDGQ